MQKYNRLPAGTLAVRSDAVGTVVAAVYSWHIILSLPMYESYTLYTTICLQGSIANSVLVFLSCHCREVRILHFWFLVNFCHLRWCTRCCWGLWKCIWAVSISFLFLTMLQVTKREGYIPSYCNKCLCHASKLSHTTTTELATQTIIMYSNARA